MTLGRKNILDFIKFIRIGNGVLVIISIIVYLFLSEHLRFENTDVFIVILISFFSISAGNIINDIYDIDIDRINRKDRLIASERISLSTAKTIYIGLSSLSILLSFYLNMYATILVIFNTILLFLYSYKLKNIALLGNISVAYLSASIFIFTELSLRVNGPLWIIFFLTFFIHLSREIIKDLEDIEGDSINNLLTFPIVFGISKTKKIIFIINFLFFLYTILILKFSLSNWVLSFSFMLLFVLPLLIQSNKLYHAKDKNDFSLISKFIKFQMLLGIIFLMINKHDIT